MLQHDPATAFARPPKQLPMADFYSAILASVHVGRTSSARRSDTKKAMSCPMTEDFKIPRGLICAHPKYFDSLFRKQFAESKSLCSQLPDVEPWVFRCFLSWLYTGVIYYDFGAAVPSPAHRREEPTTNANKDDEDGDEDLGANPITWSFRDLFELYVFGDEYDAREFRMSVMDLIQAKLLQSSPTQYNFPTIRDMKYISSHVPSSSSLLRFLADAWQGVMMLIGSDPTEEADDEFVCEMQEDMERFPKSFLVLCAKGAVRNALALACVTCEIQSEFVHLGAEDGPSKCTLKNHSFEDRLDWDQKDRCLYHGHGTDESEKALCQERWAKIAWRLEMD